MKKILSLILMVAMLMSVNTFVYAEQIEIDTSFEGVIFTYEDINMQIKIPSEWYRAELADEYVQAGYFDCFAAEDGTYTLLKLVNQNIEEILAVLQGDETYQDVELITINGIQAIIYVNTTLNNYGTIIPFSDGTMSVQMEMGPAGDQAIAQTLMTLMATVDTIQ